MSHVDFNFGSGLAVPFDAPPAGCMLATNVVVGVRPDGSYALEQRLPSGVAFDSNNPAHVFGWFVVNAAQDLMSHAMGMRAEAARVNQTDEMIVSKQLAKG